MMETYLVGGAVRDKLLGRPVHERDYVVVGATEAEMKAAGYRSVGRDFPVFLHPETQEEYALARTERKTGPGHQGFVCHADPDVTLEEDLMRRDLTINAIAEDKDGQLIDPYGGQVDLADRVLRHVSTAFTEDPLRILRVARFKATLPDFDVHADTLDLMQRMVSEGSLQELTPERVLLELDKALVAESPAAFFDCLETLDGNAALWPELDSNAVDELRNLASKDPDARFAVLLQSFSTGQINDFCDRYRCANLRRELTLLISNRLAGWLQDDDLNADAIVNFLYQADAFRKRDRFVRFHQLCEEITRQTRRWLDWLDVAAAVKASDVTEDVTGPQMGEAIKRKQVEVISGQLK